MNKKHPKPPLWFTLLGITFLYLMLTYGNLIVLVTMPYIAVLMHIAGFIYWIRLPNEHKFTMNENSSGIVFLGGLVISGITDYLVLAGALS